jgi:hypothetical protein
MEQWEYLTLFLSAKANNRETRTFIKTRFNKRPKRFSPESMIPQLDKLGAEGWEMLHMEPVARVGGKEDVLFDQDYRWSNTYFCVFKRRKAGAVPVSVAPTHTPKPPTTEG